jgi:tetratricopeptide (TPR) repeat protein
MATVEFFISYAGADRAWAEWIAWQLEAAGHTTRLQAWDFQAGSDFVHQMEQALRDAERLILVLSPAYRASQFGEAEWRPIFTKDPSGELGLLVPLRVQECDPPELLRARVFVDLVGLPELEAAERLLAAVRLGERPGRPTTAPAYPGATAPAAAAVQPPFPGSGPSISNLAPRNPHFTGRAELLDRLGERLADGVAAAVAAHGLGGVGKTQLALEYAHRHLGDYQLVWWVPAETRLLATASLAELAVRLGLEARTEQAEQAAAALAELAGRDGWLVIFDNAEEPEDLKGLWPAGRGQVLVTSRNPAWGGHATRLAVDVLADAEATEFLLARTGSSDRRAAEALAAELGGLPLALEQAAAYLEETGLELVEYLARFRRYHAELLARGRPTRYPATVATTWQLNLEQLGSNQPAVGLLRLCGFFAPETIPPSLLTADPEALPEELAAVVGDELALDATVAALYRFSLLDRDHDGLRLHRLVGEVVRATLRSHEQGPWAAAAVTLVDAGFPVDIPDPASWPVCARLLPHALATSDNAERLEVAAEQTVDLLNRVGQYLARRAEFAAARATHERALRLAEATYGPDHPAVAIQVNNLGTVLREQGDLTEARAHFERALRIDEATDGSNHPGVATSVNNLGDVLRELGDLAGAKAHYGRALRIGEAIYGPNHPTVAIRVNNLGEVLRQLGDLAGAKTHFERALRIDEAALGPNHPTVAIRVMGMTA